MWCIEIASIYTYAYIIFVSWCKKKKNEFPIQAVSRSEGLGPGHQGCSFFFCRGWCHPQASCGQVLIGVRLGARD